MSLPRLNWFQLGICALDVGAAAQWFGQGKLLLGILALNAGSGSLLLALL